MLSIYPYIASIAFGYFGAQGFRYDLQLFHIIKLPSAKQIGRPIDPKQFRIWPEPPSSISVAGLAGGAMRSRSNAVFLGSGQTTLGHARLRPILA